MASRDSYADIYSKQRNLEGNRSKSRQPARSNHSSVENIELMVSDLNSKVGKTEFQQLALKVAQAESKIVSLTNIVKLVQKYTETQDMQYEKDRQTFMNKEAVLSTLIIDQQRRLDKEEKRIFEIDELYQQYKGEFENIRKFRDVMSSNTDSSKTFKFDHRQHLSQIELSEALKSAEDKLRLELNRKIEICMDEIKNVPTREELHQLIQDVRNVGGASQAAFKSTGSNYDDRAVNSEIQSIKHTLNSLVVSSRASPGKPILKGSNDKLSLKDVVKFQDLIEFREEIDAKLKHIVDKFSLVVKKYVGKSVSPLRHTESTSEKPTMRKDQRNPELVRENLNPNISEYNARGRSKSKSKKKKVDEISNPDQRHKKIQKSKSRSKSHSRSKSRSRSLSKHSHKSKHSDNSSRPSSRPKGIADRRKEKGQQLKQMMRKTKQQKDKLAKDRKGRIL